MDKIIINRTQPLEIAKLRKLFKRAVKNDFNYFPEEYKKKVLAKNNLMRLLFALKKPDRIIMTASSDKKIKGFILANLPTTNVGQIHWLYVAPDSRKMGVGKKLLKACLRDFKKQGVNKVVLETHNYQDYYLRRGFTLSKINKMQFSTITMYIMSISL